jgi:hypothetical protein
MVKIGCVFLRESEGFTKGYGCLALMAAASFYGVQRSKRYSVQ